MKFNRITYLFLFLVAHCILFSQKTLELHQLSFVNKVENIEILNDVYIYNGSGVAVGDLNNDSLPDIYFVSAYFEDKLFKNSGDFNFKDITQTSGISNSTGISRGVSFLDINYDGLLDIFISKTGLSFQNNGYRANKLYINKGNFKFEEDTTYHFASYDFTTQILPIDINGDNFLDIYVANCIPTHNQAKDSFPIIVKENMQIFYPGYYDNIYYGSNTGYTQERTKNLGYTLGIAAGDFDNNGFADIILSNDFDTPNSILINSNGKLSNETKKTIRSDVYLGMGVDVADVNDDGNLDFFAVDMAPKKHERSKMNMISMDVDKFYTLTTEYGIPQYMVNNFQLNTGLNNFQSISSLLKISKTDWSWATLIFDIENDGSKDILVTNGIRRDIQHRDSGLSKYLTKSEFNENISKIPSEKTSNFIFKNQGNLSFYDASNSIGFEQPTWSNGAAIADLDLDGDLDIVINNIDMPAFVYENKSDALHNNNFIQYSCHGPRGNAFGIGARVTLFHDSTMQMQELFTTRGYLSSVEPKLTFGIGKKTKIDSVAIRWPDGKIEVIINPKINTWHVVEYNNAKNYVKPKIEESTLFRDITEDITCDYKHTENEYIDFYKEILLPHKQSEHGPGIAVGDINEDGLDDLAIGGAKYQSTKIFLQLEDGHFVEHQCTAISNDSLYEDLGILLFHANTDKFLDLYIASGGNSFSGTSPLSQDRLYYGDGKGGFTKQDNALPSIINTTSTVNACDYDNDGDLDLFVGGRLKPQKYPFVPKSYILKNENGKFTNTTPKICPELENIGMVTSALWTDFDNDNDMDLLVVGEWMRIEIFENKKSKFVQMNLPELQNTRGWWNSISAGDFDNDGDIDYILGNVGLNTKHYSSKKQFQIHASDFDDSGNIDIVLSHYYPSKDVSLPVRGKECSTQQIPYIGEKFPTFRDYAFADLNDIYGSEKLDKSLHYTMDIFSSIYLENLNDGKGFNIHELPIEAQFSWVHGSLPYDVNCDGNLDVVLVGNYWGCEPETPRYDASIGLVLLGNGNGSFKPLSVKESGWFAPHNARSLSCFQNNNERMVFVTTNNNDKMQFFELNKPCTNASQGIKEIYYGSGYLSQKSRHYYK